MSCGLIYSAAFRSKVSTRDIQWETGGGGKLDQSTRTKLARNFRIVLASRRGIVTAKANDMLPAQEILSEL